MVRSVFPSCGVLAETTGFSPMGVVPSWLAGRWKGIPISAGRPLAGFVAMPSSPAPTQNTLTVPRTSTMAADPTPTSLHAVPAQTKKRSRLRHLPPRRKRHQAKALQQEERSSPDHEHAPGQESPSLRAFSSLRRWGQRQPCPHLASRAEDRPPWECGDPN